MQSFTKYRALITNYAKKIVYFKYLLSFVAFDTSTEEGRSKERYRRSVLTAVAAISSKLISSVTLIISIPLTIDYLGRERFGLWMTLSSIILMLNIFSDFGLGIALMNKISEAKGKQNKNLIIKYLSTSFFILCMISCCLLIVSVLINSTINWADLFKLKTTLAIEEINSSLIVLIITFIINLPLTVVDRFQDGLQEGYWNNVSQAIGALLALFGIIISIWFQWGLKALVFSSLSIPVFVRLINFFIQFKLKNQWAWPQFKLIEKQCISPLLKLGYVFFILNIFNVIGYHSDSVIISGYLGTSSVALYSILQKFSLLLIMLLSFTNSMWPAYTEAIARGDLYWVRNTIIKTTTINFIVSAAIGVLIVVFGNWIITVWIGKNLDANNMILFAFAFYTLTTGMIGAVAVICNSSQLFKKQMPFFISASLISFLLKILLAERFGINAVVWASVIGYGFFYVIPCLIIIKKTFWKNDSSDVNEKYL